MSQDFHINEYLDTALLLERFLADCQALSEEFKGDLTSFAYTADTIAAVYYHREYDSAVEFIKENSEYIDKEREDWVRRIWKTLDQMDEEHKAELVIESLSHLNSVSGI